MWQYLTRHRNVYGWLFAALCLLVAVIYMAVVPAEAVVRTGWQYMILRYGHSIVWILLACASGAWGVQMSRFMKMCLGGAALTYGLFVILLLV